MSVGIEVTLEKVSESEHVAEYKFFVREGNGGLALQSPTGAPGFASIRKETGRVELQRECPDDPAGLLFARASVALRRHWKVGEYPSVTSWAG
jgi:hypothetical protein